MRRSQTIGFTATLVVSLAVAPGVQANTKPKAFNGKACTIVGTSKSEKLTGTPKADVICGLGGNDTINGLGGNDTIDGGTGNDVLSGGEGNDSIDGGTGNDTINGQNGNDALTGDSGNDSLNGGTGNDTLQGETGSDVFAGGTGTDTAKYSEKTTALTLDIDNRADDGVAGEKDNIKSDVENIIGGKGNDKITGSSAANTISGGSGNDTISGGGGNDSLLGGNSDDSLNGQGGFDTYDGGAGLNSCYLEEAEARDFTCSLLPNLAYLLKRVSGEVKSLEDNYYEGCNITLQRKDRRGLATVQAPFYRQNKFTFDVPAGDYNWAIDAKPRVRGEGGSSPCGTRGPGIRIEGRSQVVDDNTPHIIFEIPRMVKTRVYVRNSRGTPLKGAEVSTISENNPGCPISVTNMCGSFDWIVMFDEDYTPRTNASGYYEVYLPEGVKVEASARVKFAGITMEVKTIEDVLLTYPSTNINLIIQ
jgi:hypothetical protein